MSRHTYTDRKYVLKGHGKTQVNIYNQNYELVTMLPSCYLYCVHFAPHCSVSRRFLTNADIVSFLLIPRLTRHLCWPTTNIGHTHHNTYIRYQICFMLLSIYLSLSLSQGSRLPHGNRIQRQIPGLLR